MGVRFSLLLGYPIKNPKSSENTEKKTSKKVRKKHKVKTPKKNSKSPKARHSAGGLRVCPQLLGPVLLGLNLGLRLGWPCGALYLV